MWFENAGSWTDLKCCQRLPFLTRISFWKDACAYNISTPELLISLVKKVGQMIPDHYIGLNENSFRLRRIFVDQFLRFWTKSQVADNDIAVARE